MLASRRGRTTWAASKARIRTVFTEALKESQSTIAGTALINWHNLSLHDQSLDGAEISNAALALANDPQAASASKTAALQVCCLRGLTQVLPIAKDLARHASDLALRASAIAAVGAFGGNGEAPLLRDLQQAKELPARTAARAAIERIKARLNG